MKSFSFLSVPRAALAALALCASSLVQADVVYTSPAFANVANPMTQVLAGVDPGGTTFMPSDVFTMASAATLTGVDIALWNNVTPSSQWSLQVQIWSPDLSSLLYSQTYGFGSYTYSPIGTWMNHDFGLVSVPLVGVPSLPAGSYRMSWADTSQLTGVMGYAGSTLWTTFDAGAGPTTVPLNRGAAFQLTGAVPEPATYMAMLVGLCLLGVSVWRRNERR